MHRRGHVCRRAVRNGPTLSVSSNLSNRRYAASGVAATHHGSSYTTTVTAGLSCTLHVGATVPAGAQVHNVTLNGSPAQYAVRDTNAGRELLVSTPCRGQTWQVHVVAG